MPARLRREDSCVSKSIPGVQIRKEALQCAGKTSLTMALFVSRLDECPAITLKKKKNHYLPKSPLNPTFIETTLLINQSDLQPLSLQEYYRLCSPQRCSHSIMVSLIGFVQLVIHWDSCWVTNNGGTRCTPHTAHRVQSGPLTKTHLAHRA